MSGRSCQKSVSFQNLPCEWGFRALYDARGFFEGYGRRLPGGGTVYAVSSSGEPMPGDAFSLRLSKNGDIRGKIREAAESGGSSALLIIQEEIADWVRQQLTRSGNPNPWMAIAHHLRAHRLVEEADRREDFLRQAGRALRSAASLMEDDDDPLSEAFVRGCLSAASRCERHDTRMSINGLVGLLQQISRYFLIEHSCSDPGDIEALKKRAAGEMLHQISWQGQKLVVSQFEFPPQVLI